MSEDDRPREARAIDPAGKLADLVERDEIKIEIDDDQDVDELRDFVERVEDDDFGPVGPGLEAQIRIVRYLLESHDDGGEQ